jgi:nitrogen-specific signal transduction histidine kinase
MVLPPDWASKRNLGREALDRLDGGIILVDSKACVLFANRAAEALLADGAGLRIEDHMLAARRSDDTAALRQMIEETGLYGSGGTSA